MKFPLILSALLFSPVLANSQTTPSKPSLTKAPTPVSAAPAVLRKGSGRSVSSLKLSSDGKTTFVTANSGQIEVYDLATRKLLRELRGGMGAYELAVSPSAQEVASSTTDFWVSINKVADGAQRAHFFLGAVGGATGLDWSRDGKMLATASSNQVGLFNSDGKMLAKREGAIGVGPNTVAFSPDGTRLVAGWSDRTLLVYDTANFEKTQFEYQGPKLHQVAQLLGHEGAVTTLAWSRNGKFLASGDASGQVRIWDFAAQKNLGSWIVGSSPIESLVWAPSGASVAIATKSIEGGAAVQLWDVAKNKAKMMWKHPQPARQVAFAADGQTLVVGDTQGEISLVPVAAFAWPKTVAPQPIDLTQPVVTLPGNLETSALSWSSNGQFLASAGATQLQVRDLKSGASLRVPQSHTQQITHVAFSPDAKLVATSGYSGAEVAEIATQKVLWRREDRAVIAGWGSDSSTLYLAEKNKGNRSQIAAFDARSGALQKLIGSIPGGYTPLEAQLSPNRDKIAIAVLMNYTNNLYTTMLEVWDIAGAKLDWGSSLDGWCDALAWSRDGRGIVAKAGDRAHAFPNGIDFVPGRLGVKWHDAATGDLDVAKSRRDFRDPVEALAFSPDGQTLVVSFERGPAQLWNSDAKFRTELESSNGNVSAWAFSSDGKRLAAGGKGAPLHIWTLSQK